MTSAATPGQPPASEAATVHGRELVLLGVTFLVASCGFVYELVLIALGSYLIGNTVFQTSLVLATFVSTMGLGSLLSKRMQARPLQWFIAVEAAIALVGGLSALVLYWAFAWVDLYQPAMIAIASLVGLLVGCEIPLMMTLIADRRSRVRSAGRSVADLLAADYLGAMLAGLAFPLLVLPVLGQLRSALAVGVLNAVAGIIVVLVCRSQSTGQRAQHHRALTVAIAPLVLVIGLLLVVAVWSTPLEARALQALYDDPVVLHERTPYQDIVVTRSLTSDDLRLFIDGDLQFSSVDEYRYHEALVLPVMARNPRRVLVLGGGDGLAMREVLRYGSVRQAVQVDLDAKMLELAREHPELARLNAHSLRDSRVEVVTSDAFRWVRQYRGPPFDAVVVDLPDPESAALAKLYAREFYAMVRARALAPSGRMVVQAGSPFFAREAFWCIERTIAAAGLYTTPYHVNVPSFGDWGYVLAAVGVPPTVDSRPAADPRFFTPAVARASASFAPDTARTKVIASTLDRPTILEYSRIGWKHE